VRQTRETFAGLSTPEEVLWYVLIAISVAVFAWGVWTLIAKYRTGRGRSRPRLAAGGTSTGRARSVARRTVRTARVVLTHSSINRRAGISGIAHAGVFYGFIVLALGSAILAIQDDVARPLLGFDFWHGTFYLVYSLFLDVFGAALTIGLVALAVKRGIGKPGRLDYRRADRATGGYDRGRYVVGDWVFVGSLMFLAVTGFVLEGVRIADANRGFDAWGPLGWLLGQGFRGVGLDGSGAQTVHHALWWVHGVVALAFVAAIPFTKALHMLTGPASVATGDEAAGKQLPMLPRDATAEQVGYGAIGDFAPRELLQLDACTKCGKCHDACPATAGGFPLSPRDLVLDLREVAEGAVGIRSQLHVPPMHDPGRSILGDPIRSETLWSCMSCMACVEICPVGIEHVPLINQMRRRLVEQGDMDSQLQATFETVHTTGNSFGENKRKRARWTKGLPFPVKDIRKEPAEFLWFLGDYASFDPRNQRITQTIAQLLHEAGVDFGVLYDAERNAGCDVRRAGEEGLFSSLAKTNVATISGCDFDRIFTWDPHSFHTLKNEYPEFGGAWTVLHHTELLLELFDRDVLVAERQLDSVVTYHDPCTLGRYNGVFEPPREVLRRIGVELREMPRNRDNSFCCGAGGGRIWMKDRRAEGVRRPSEQRIDEAVALGDVEYFTVACPKDVTMYEDAIRSSGHDGAIELREISELVAAAVGLRSEPPGVGSAVGRSDARS
jgi:Fe-S oxidoreductase